MNKKIILLMFVAFIMSYTLVKGSKNEGLSPLIQNIDSRATQTLNGHWQYIIDPYEVGYYNYRKQPHYPDGEGFFMDRTPEHPSDHIEYNFDREQTLHVPGDWNTQAEKLFYYEGNIWYRRKFDKEIKENKRYFVHFGAVNYEAIVYLNTKKLGVHEGGFTAFNFEITDEIKQENNSLILKVDNRRFADAVPTDNTDWYNYGGITRPVNIIETPEIFIRDYFIQLNPEDPGKISGWVQMDGTNPSQNIGIAISGLNLEHEITTNDDGYAEFSFSAEPTRWCIDNPKLYDVKITAETDKVKDEIGFRTIEADGTKILLNGEEVFSRGISIHEEAPHRSGRAWSQVDAEALLGMAEELGVNFVRLAHYPHNETMVKEAERRGLLVWSEIPVYWTISWDNPGTLQNARNQLDEMISRDKNRANVIIWSISNEAPVSEARNNFLKTLIEDTKKQDPSRLVAMAMEVQYVDEKTRTIGDPLAEHLDVLSFNQYLGWYVGQPDDLDHLEWVFPQQKPVFISEMGGGALQGYHGEKNLKWSEEFQENLYIHTIDMLKRMEGLAGLTPWILMDFRSPRRPLPDIKDGFNRKGLYSDQTIKKKAFYILQDWYEELKHQGK